MAFCSKNTALPSALYWHMGVDFTAFQSDIYGSEAVITMKLIRKIEASLSSAPIRKKVAAYARISEEKGRTRRSLAAQVSYYSELIQGRAEWEYAGVYADGGISGTTDSRAEFKQMLADCEAGKIDIILTKSISRFARNTVDLLNTVRHLRELGIEVRFEKERINSLSEDGECSHYFPPSRRRKAASSAKM